MTTDAARRVREFLDAYPNDGSSNVDPEHIYTYGADGELHTLNWSDLDKLCRFFETVTAGSLDGLSVELPSAYDPNGTNAIAWRTGIDDFRNALSHNDVQSER